MTPGSLTPWTFCHVPLLNLMQPSFCFYRSLEAALICHREASVIILQDFILACDTSSKCALLAALIIKVFFLSLCLLFNNLLLVLYPILKYWNPTELSPLIESCHIHSPRWSHPLPVASDTLTEDCSSYNSSLGLAL